MTEAERIAMLEPPSGTVQAVLDTDTYNEIDDQFALVYAVLHENLDLQAIYAAPFHNKRSVGPGDGMRRSLEEIHRLAERLDLQTDGFVMAGSESYMPAAEEPVDSPAARDLIARAQQRELGDPLYVIAIGAPTNVSSAIRMAPDILDRLVVVWLGGHGFDWPTAREFNLKQDLHASRTLFDSGVPLVQVPCCPVAEKLRTSHEEIDAFVAGRGAIGDYLAEIFHEFVGREPGHSKVLWDLAAVAWPVLPEAVMTALMHSPMLSEERNYSHDPNRHLIRAAWHVRRDEVFGDLFRLLEA